MKYIMLHVVRADLHRTKIRLECIMTANMHSLTGDGPIVLLFSPKLIGIMESLYLQIGYFFLLQKEYILPQSIHAFVNVCIFSCPGGAIKEICYAFLSLELN